MTGGSTATGAGSRKAALSRDRALIAAWREGDDKALLDLLELYDPLFRAFCRRWHVWHDDATELFHEAFGLLLEKPALLDIERSFGGIYYCVLNDARRKLEPRPAPDPERLSSPESLSHEAKTAFWEVVDQCQEGLKDVERFLLIARIYEKIPFRTLSRILGICERTLASTYHRVRDRMRECMKNKGVLTAS